MSAAIAHAKMIASQAEWLFESIWAARVGAGAEHCKVLPAKLTALILVRSDQIGQSVKERLGLRAHAVPIERRGDHPKVVLLQTPNQWQEIIGCIDAFVRVVADL